MAHARHTHSKHHHHPVNEKRLLAATLLNLVITVVEVAGGFLSGSIALMSDALHNLSDTFATFIAYMAILIGKREANSKKTFGYKRVEILAALLNAVILLIICLFLLKEAYQRLNDPRSVNSVIMIIVAMIGLLANLFAIIILKKDAHKSLNVKAAYVHLIGDAFSSLLVVAGGLLIRFWHIYWIDPLITAVIAIYIIREAFVILRESVQILMQSAPENLDLEMVRRRVEKDPEINNIHHLHAWMLTDQQVHLEAHIELTRDVKLSEVTKTRQEIEKMLKREFGINHVTLQFEYDPGHAPHLIHQEITKSSGKND
ncbi:MAG: cation diffusion facilitator family transporter [Bacteroidota bacterium]